jgi:hypothetical protein
MRPAPDKIKPGFLLPYNRVLSLRWTPEQQQMEK